jgi:hypothetical protein
MTYRQKQQHIKVVQAQQAQQNKIKTTQPKKQTVVQTQTQSKVNKPQTQILRKSPEKNIENELHNEKRMREIIEETIKKQSPKPKKEKKKWYDSVLQTAENVIPSLLPYLPMVLGMGDYTEEDMPMTTQKMPETNTLLANVSKGKVGNDVPYMHSDGVSVRIPHREYVGDLYSSTNSFDTTLLRINPGLNDIFEWLGPIAGQFTSSRIGGAIVEFVSTGSDYSNAAGLGYVGVAAQYNNNETPFDNKDDMLNSQYANMDKPSRSFGTWIECSPNIVGEQPKYVRTGSVPPNADINLYDHCMVTIAVGGNTAANAIIGSIYITYDIDLFIPRPRSSSSIDLAEYVINDVSNVAPLGASTFSHLKQPQSTISLDFINVSNAAYFPKTIRKGRYMVVIRWDSTTPVASVSVPTLTGINCTVYNTFVSLLGEGSTNGQYNGLVAYLNLSTNTTQLACGFELSSPCDIANGSTTAFLTVTQLPEYYAPSLTDIFDLHGRGREFRYQDFMKQFRQIPKPEWILVKKFKTFELKQKTNPDEVIYGVQLNERKEIAIIAEAMFKGLQNSVNPDAIVQRFLISDQHLLY